MDNTPVALNPLEAGYLRVLQLGAVVPASLLLAGAVAAGWFAARQVGALGWAATLPIVAIAAWSGLFAPRRRWAAWGWALADGELHVARGVWVQVHTVVPLARVQHIDVAQGPIERANQVARLIVHTAGTEHATVTLPGITRATAEELRDTIRGQIRSDPW
ncbi:MAG: PH domain-containing protein [Pseudomonadota bacterium]